MALTPEQTDYDRQTPKCNILQINDSKSFIRIPQNLSAVVEDQNPVYGQLRVRALGTLGTWLPFSMYLEEYPDFIQLNTIFSIGNQDRYSGQYLKYRGEFGIFLSQMLRQELHQEKPGIFAKDPDTIELGGFVSDINNLRKADLPDDIYDFFRGNLCLNRNINVIRGESDFGYYRFQLIIENLIRQMQREIPIYYKAYKRFFACELPKIVINRENLGMTITPTDIYEFLASRKNIQMYQHRWVFDANNRPVREEFNGDMMITGSDGQPKNYKCGGYCRYGEIVFGILLSEKHYYGQTQLDMMSHRLDQDTADKYHTFGNKHTIREKLISEISVFDKKYGFIGRQITAKKLAWEGVTRLEALEETCDMMINSYSTWVNKYSL